MNLKFLVQSTVEIILNPANAWEIIESRKESVGYLLWNLFLPLILLAAVSALLGSLLFTNPGLTKAYSVIAGVRYLLMFLLVLLGTTLIFTEITNLFHAGRDFNISFKIIAYSLVPFLLCQVLSLLFESLIFVNVLALFGLYICWTGIGKLINPPEKQVPFLLISATLVFIILFIIINWALTISADKLYFAFLT